MPTPVPRSLARRLALAAVPLTLGLAAPRPAAAQWDNLFPACTTRTLAEYLTQLGCTAGGAVFANFAGRFVDPAPSLGRTLADVLVQPMAVGRTISFAFTLPEPIVVTGSPLLLPTQSVSDGLFLDFDVFGFPATSGGSLYLSMLPLVLGNALTAGAGYDARLTASVRSESPVYGPGRAYALFSTDDLPFCYVSYASGEPFPRPCFGDPRGLAVPNLGQHVQVDLAGSVGRNGDGVSGPPARVTLGNITVAFELPPLPVPPEEPQTPPTTVPEPGTWALLGTGLLGVWGVARRRRARPAA